MASERLTNKLAWFTREINFFVFLSISYHSFIKFELQAISSEAKSRIFCNCDKNRKPLDYFTCVLRSHFKEELYILVIYSVIKKNDVITAYKIWISVGMNDVNNDVDQSKDIYKCLQADKYMEDVQLFKRYRVAQVLGENVFDFY